MWDTQKPTSPNYETKIIRWHELHSKIQLGRSTVWRMEREGTFPNRRKISPGAVGWVLSEIDEWISNREAA